MVVVYPFRNCMSHFPWKGFLCFDTWVNKWAGMVACREKDFFEYPLLIFCLEWLAKHLIWNEEFTCHMNVILSFRLSAYLNPHRGSPDRDSGVSITQYLIPASSFTYINYFSILCVTGWSPDFWLWVHFLFSVSFLHARNPKRLNRYWPVTTSPFGVD